MLKILEPKLRSTPWEARIALLGVLFVIMFALANSSTECARADASCQVGETAQFSSAITVNEDGNDADTRIEGDTDENLFYADAGNDRVGIGTNTPASLFDVDGLLTASTANISGGTIRGHPKDLKGIRPGKMRQKPRENGKPMMLYFKLQDLTQREIKLKMQNSLKSCITMLLFMKMSC